MNFSEAWYQKALTDEAGVDVAAGPAASAFFFYDQEVETKANQLLAAAASSGTSLEEMRPVAVELLRRLKQTTQGETSSGT